MEKFYAWKFIAKFIGTHFSKDTTPSFTEEYQIIIFIVHIVLCVTTTLRYYR